MGPKQSKNVAKVSLGLDDDFVECQPCQPRQSNQYQTHQLPFQYYPNSYQPSRAYTNTYGYQPYSNFQPHQPVAGNRSADLQIVSARQCGFLDIWNKNDNYFEILGLDENATEDDIRRAYRREILRHHPDKHVDEIVATAAANAATQRLTEAYHFLVDNDRRKQLRRTVMHDRGWFSISRWKTIWEGIKENPIRFALQALSSVLCVIGGVAAIGCSAGTATGPVVAANVAAAALCGAGINSGRSLVRRKSVVEGHPWSEYANSALCGAVTGFAGSGKSRGIGYIGNQVRYQ